MLVFSPFNELKTAFCNNVILYSDKGFLEQIVPHTGVIPILSVTLKGICHRTNL